MRYVLDASVAVRWFVHDAPHPAAERILVAVVSHPGRFAVPELFGYELLSVLHRHHPRATRVMREGVDPVLRSGVLRYPLTPAIVNRAERYIARGMTGYDATYVALAEELDGLWLTFDSRAHAKISDLRRSIDLSFHDLPDDLVDGRSGG